MSRRLFETSGNFVIDQFFISTKTVLVSNTTPNTDVDYFRVYVDPGQAYISGNRVKTYTNKALKIRKGIDTVTSNSVAASLNFGNYIDVHETAGIFGATTGDTINLLDTAKNFYSVSTTGFATSNINAPAAATTIGTARIRAKTFVYGTPGTADAKYRLYLFDINISNGYNIRQTKGISAVNSNNSTKGIADVSLVYDASSNSNIASLSNTNNSRMVFNIGANFVSQSQNYNYTYKTLDEINADLDYVDIVHTVFLYGDSYDRRMWGNEVQVYVMKDGSVYMDEALHDDAFC